MRIFSLILALSVISLGADLSFADQEDLAVDAPSMALLRVAHLRPSMNKRLTTTALVDIYALQPKDGDFLCNRLLKSVRIHAIDEKSSVPKSLVVRVPGWTRQKASSASTAFWLYAEPEGEEDACVSLRKHAKSISNSGESR